MNKQNMKKVITELQNIDKQNSFDDIIKQASRILEDYDCFGNHSNREDVIDESALFDEYKTISIDYIIKQLKLHNEGYRKFTEEV